MYKRIRCFECKKKINDLFCYECKCNNFFCSKHKFTFTHNCTYDHKKEWQKTLSDKLPKIIKPKV